VEPARGVDALPEPSDLGSALERLDPALYDVRDEQASRVRPEIDHGDALLLRHGPILRGYPVGMLGAAKQRQQAHPPERADALADIVLLDHDGADVRLGELWSERPVALVWLRHYG
jgi:hypothetical protein